MASTQKHTAGLLDIRNIIGTLIAAYGVILLAMGLFGNKEEAKTGNVNANLWAGLVMLVVGLGFIVWCRVRPVVVPDSAGDTPEQPNDDPGVA